MKIWAHTLVKNEERFVWYAVNSYIKYVDRVLLWDTGSTDNTPKILEELKKQYKDKIDLKFFKSVNSQEFSQVRQEMLDCTKSDWFLVCDADEIWWNDSIKKLTNYIIQKGSSIESIYTPAVLMLGDMYHSQERLAGKYKIKGDIGHFGLKAINRNISGLSSLNPHGSWGWVDGEKKMIQDREPDKVVFVDAPFMHTTNLLRSKDRCFDKNVPKRNKKYKVEIGNKLFFDYYYPESFFLSRPSFVASVWKTMSFDYKLRAFFQTPLKKLKRRIIK